MPNATTTATLTSADAARAFYLDFEGFTNEAPALLGVMVDDSFETLVLDPVLRPAAQDRGLRVTDGEAALRRILERARLEDRLICAFGNREREAALEDFGVDFGERFVNVQRVAKRWWRSNRTEQPKRRRGKKAWRRSRGYSLEFFEKGLGLERPKHLKSGNATKRLRGVRDPLIGHKGDWSQLTGTAKSKWTKLLDYNQVDVRNLAALAKGVARGRA
ncbi:MAG: hypothetical protein RLN75_00890 [Longimicrobiales bacterium]